MERDRPKKSKRKKATPVSREEELRCVDCGLVATAPTNTFELSVGCVVCAFGAVLAPRRAELCADCGGHVATLRTPLQLVVAQGGKTGERARSCLVSLKQVLRPLVSSGLL